MKNIVVARFIFFILASICIYCYMGSMLAMQIPGEAEVKEIKVEKIQLEDSYKIWEAIEKLEDSLGQKESNTGQKAKNSLEAFYSEDKYPYLEKDIKALIAAHATGDWEDFLDCKEIIMKELRSIWIEQRYRIQEGWWQWFKNRTRNLLQRMYNYLSSSK